MNIGRKLGPFPIWMWGVLLGGGILLYRHYANANSSAAVGSGFDPNAVDPNTGLTYGQELAGMQGGGALTPTTGATTDGSSGPSPSQEIQGAMGGVAEVAALLKVMEQLFKDVGAFRHQVTGKPPKKPPPKKPPKGIKKPPPPRGWTTGGRGRGHHAKHHSHHRAPAHPNEQTNARAHTHGHHKQPPPKIQRDTGRHRRG